MVRCSSPKAYKLSKPAFGTMKNGETENNRAYKKPPYSPLGEQGGVRGVKRNLSETLTKRFDHVHCHGIEVEAGLPVPFLTGAEVVDAVGPRRGDAFL